MRSVRGVRSKVGFGVGLVGLVVFGGGGGCGYRLGD